MPKTAELVDQLREAFGAEHIDGLMRQGKVGRGGFWAAEVGPDGELRQYGSRSDGKRAELVDGRVEVVG